MLQLLKLQFYNLALRLWSSSCFSLCFWFRKYFHFTVIWENVCVLLVQHLLKIQSFLSPGLEPWPCHLLQVFTCTLSGRIPKACVFFPPKIWSLPFLVILTCAHSMPNSSGFLFHHNSDYCNFQLVNRAPLSMLPVCSMPPSLQWTGFILIPRHPWLMQRTSHTLHSTQTFLILDSSQPKTHLVNQLSFSNWSHSDKDWKCTPIVSSYCFQLHMLLPATMQSVHFMLVCKCCSHQTIDSHYLN